MASETNRPGFIFKEDIGTADYVDNRVEINSQVSTLKIINDGAADLEFATNREEDTNEVDGIVKVGEELNLSDIKNGLSSIAVKGASAYRLWAYQ